MRVGRMSYLKTLCPRPLQKEIASLGVDLDTITSLDPEDRPESILKEIESLFPKRQDVFYQPDLIGNCEPKRLPV